VYTLITGSCEKNQRTLVPIGGCSMTAPYTRDAKLCHQKIIEAVSRIYVYPGILTKKQARCTVTWHANYTECSDKFQVEKNKRIALQGYSFCYLENRMNLAGDYWSFIVSAAESTTMDT
jgi:hypothetical protein